MSGKRHFRMEWFIIPINTFIQISIHPVFLVMDQWMDRFLTPTLYRDASFLLTDLGQVRVLNDEFLFCPIFKDHTHALIFTCSAQDHDLS